MSELLTSKAEKAIVTGVVAGLGLLALGIKAVEAANAWVRWQTDRRPLPGGAVQTRR